MVATHPMPIPGAWRQGYVLDYHTVSSRLLGYDGDGNPMFDTTRTELGELLYRLKYKRDLQVLDSLVETAVNFIKSWQISFDAMVTVPPTKVRQLQPVFELGDRLAKALEVPLLKDFVQSIKKAKELKKRL